MTSARTDRRVLADLLVVFGAIARIVNERHTTPTARLASIRQALANAGIEAPVRPDTAARLARIRRALLRVGVKRAG
jgi:hypothetical protein